ncbi:beta glucosidase 40 [Actinidia rufa]|uniref:Beta glucosidase 40 n=1 Tax=Actinidia rufa TaxID=165716 RepID=A0A7J0EQK7_9ERIC|nr:beta glucosidase 40 [Actinidia rufa]
MRKGSVLGHCFGGFWDPEFLVHDPVKVMHGTPCSSSYEGAVKEDGRGQTVWDVFAHSFGKVLDFSNADVAINQYHLFDKDIQLMKDMGMDAYKFSIAWSRIFPNGTGEINQAGVDHYNNLINALLANVHLGACEDALTVVSGSRDSKQHPHRATWSTQDSYYNMRKQRPYPSLHMAYSSSWTSVLVSPLLKEVIACCGLTFMQVSINFVKTVLIVNTLMRREWLPFLASNLLNVYTVVPPKREPGTNLFMKNHYLRLRSNQQLWSISSKEFLLLHLSLVASRPPLSPRPHVLPPIYFPVASQAELRA